VANVTVVCCVYSSKESLYSTTVLTAWTTD